MLNRQSTNCPADSLLRRKERNHSWLCWCVRLAKDSGQIHLAAQTREWKPARSQWGQNLHSLCVLHCGTWCSLKKHQHKQRREVPRGCCCELFCTIETSFGTFKMTMLSMTSGWKNEEPSVQKHTPYYFPLKWVTLRHTWDTDFPHFFVLLLPCWGSCHERWTQSFWWVITHLSVEENILVL